MNLSVGDVISIHDANENELDYEINYIFEGYIPDFLGTEMNKNSGIILIHSDLNKQLKYHTSEMKKLSYSNREDNEALETLSPQKRLKMIDQILFLGNAKIYIMVSTIGLFLVFICVFVEITQLIKEKKASIKVYRTIGVDSKSILICYLIHSFQYLSIVFWGSMIISGCVIRYILKLFQSKMYNALLLDLFITYALFVVIFIGAKVNKMKEE